MKLSSCCVLTTRRQLSGPYARDIVVESTELPTNFFLDQSPLTKLPNNRGGHKDENDYAAELPELDIGVEIAAFSGFREDTKGKNSFYIYKLCGPFDI